MTTSIIAPFKLVHPIVTSKNWTILSKSPEVRQALKSAKVYLIVRRGDFRLLNVSWQDSGVHGVLRFDVTQIGKGVLFSRCELNLDEMYSPEEKLTIHLTGHDPDEAKTGILQGFEIEAKNGISWFNFEGLCYHHQHEHIQVKNLDFAQFEIPYEVLYVGKATEQHVIDRLSVHSQLLEILASLRPLCPESVVADEVVLMFLGSDYNLTLTKGDKVDSVVNDTKLDSITLSPESNDIPLDFEKALVRALDPRFNKTKYAGYPYSSDGLYKYGYNSISYLIEDNILLYSGGNMLLCSNGSLPRSQVLVTKEAGVQIV